MDKAELRRALRARRRERAAGEGQAEALAQALYDLTAPLGMGTGSILGGYLPLAGEPDVSACLRQAWQQGDRVVVPRTLPDWALEWVDWTPTSDLQPDRHGLSAPAGPADPAALIGHDGRVVLLVPALAVDSTGTRLGNGAGYYDRALQGLARWPAGPLRVAVVHPDEVMAQLLPRQPHDEPVDAVLTADGWSRTHPGPPASPTGRAG